MCGTCGFFRMMHGGVSAPLCCAFAQRVAFKDVSRHRVLLKSGPGNRGRSACGTTHRASLEFLRETSLILRCDGKVGIPFQTKQGTRPSCRDQEGRRGSDAVVLGTLVFLLSETAMLGNFWGRIKAVKYRFELQDRTWDFS